MGTEIQLQHVVHRLPVRVEHFYNGMGVARDGLISLDSDSPEMISAALLRGYRITPEGQRIDNLMDLERYIKSKTAKSEGATNEGTDNGRQPADNDRIRSRQRKGSQASTV